MTGPAGARALRRNACALVVLLAAVGCASDIELGRNVDDASAGQAGEVGVGGSSAGATAGQNNAGGSGASGGVSGGGAAAECEPAVCGNRPQPYRCGNCLDDDGDGLVDAADGQCLGPCDDTEDSYFLDLPGEGGAPCRQDCYFDQNAGPGNDGCYSSQSCDPLSLAPDYPPSGDERCAFDEQANIPGAGATCAELSETQSDACLETCGPLTPNGCDCFGCCELPAGSATFVFIGSSLDGQGSCSEAALDDPIACRRCTPVNGCLNRCDPCEVCAGRPEPLASCADASAQCGQGFATCGRPGQPICPAGEYCITGCCVVEPR